MRNIGMVSPLTLSSIQVPYGSRSPIPTSYHSRSPNPYRINDNWPRSTSQVFGTINMPRTASTHLSPVARMFVPQARKLQVTGSRQLCQEK